jgi:type II secretion system protein C
MMMSPLRVFNLKALRYFFYLALAAILVYLVGNLSGVYPYKRVADSASSSKSDTPQIQKKQPEKPTLEGQKEISDTNLSSVAGDIDNTTDPQDLPHRIENLPRASLDLILLGIMKRDDGYLEAIIEDTQNNIQGLYTVGSTIRGARVVMISGTKVVLRVDGTDQVLEMNREGTADIQQDAPLLKQANAFPTDEPSWDERSSLGYAQARLKARLKPFHQGGNQEGFEVKSIHGDSPLKAIGIEDGDIIKSINGEPIDSDLDILQIYDAIRNGDSYTISVVRDGKPITLSSKLK